MSVDVGAVAFIDSRASGTLVWACNAARADGRGFTMVNPHGQMMHVLQIMGLHDQLGHQPVTPGDTASG